MGDSGNIPVNRRRLARVGRGMKPVDYRKVIAAIDGALAELNQAGSDGDGMSPLHLRLQEIRQELERQAAGGRPAAKPEEIPRP
jgi:hypothetical protein